MCISASQPAGLGSWLGSARQPRDARKLMFLLSTTRSPLFGILIAAICTVCSPRQRCVQQMLTIVCKLPHTSLGEEMDRRCFCLNCGYWQRDILKGRKHSGDSMILQMMQGEVKNCVCNSADFKSSII